MVSTIADTPRQHRSENKLENPLKTNQLQISVRNYGRFQIAIAFLPSHLNMRAYREYGGCTRSMTLFDWLFKDPAALHRQTTAPLYNERLAFLTHMKERDRKYNTLRAMATHLLHINRTLGFSNEMRVLTMEELRSAGRAWARRK